jgi:copper(I)-binding protein
MSQRALLSTLAAAVLALSATSVWAQTTVKVDDAWVRGTVAQQKATGAFMRLTPEKNARLVAASSPVAGVVEIHEMAMENDVMKMRQIPGLDLAAGRTMDLKPGGYDHPARLAPVGHSGDHGQLSGVCCPPCMPPVSHLPGHSSCHVHRC